MQNITMLTFASIEVRLEMWVVQFTLNIRVLPVTFLIGNQ
jgi:hypothetical protein